MGAIANLDEVDWEILSILQTEARISFKELGQRIKLTGTAIAERVRKLQDEGIIEGYSIKLNREKIGLPVMAFFKLRVHVEHCQKLREMAIALPEIIEAHRVVGNEYYLLKAVLLNAAFGSFDGKILAAWLSGGVDRFVYTCRSQKLAKAALER